jgi:DNA polymerase III delta prime subunit
MRKHRGEDPLPKDKDFFRRRQFFCQALDLYIKRVDTETQWNDSYFSPLEADVIIEERNKMKKKHYNLMKALKHFPHKSSFLLLGDPGSGKSTILRKLAKDLLKEVEKTNKIPLYINLKEWTIANKPAEEIGMNDLKTFIRDNLSHGLDEMFTSEFIDDYFEALYIGGFFYFILDSFDETPLLIDESEASHLTDKVSGLLGRLCALNPNTKVILSSRFFRRPTYSYNAEVFMEIRPFNEKSMRICFDRFTNNEQLSAKLFSEHRELIGTVKNPFYASLLSLYYKNKHDFPTKEIELYGEFINSRLDKCEQFFGLLNKNQCSNEEIVKYSKIIANAIFRNDQFGIGIPRAILVSEYGIPEHVIEILEKSKLIRIGGGENMLISFSHRRFNEYFVACSFTRADIEDFIGSIPTDSKWRDTLILYAQLCSDEDADYIAEKCCEYFRIMKYSDEDITIKASSIQPLRFLTQAFSSQPERIAKHRKIIFELVAQMLNQQNVLYQKVALRTLPLLDNNMIRHIINKVLHQGIVWVQIDAIQNCTYLDSIDSDTYYHIISFFSSMPTFQFFLNMKYFYYYFKLSKVYRSVRYFCIARFTDFALQLSMFFIIASVSFYNEEYLRTAVYLIIYLLLSVCLSNLNYWYVIKFDTYPNYANQEISLICFTFISLRIGIQFYPKSLLLLFLVIVAIFILCKTDIYILVMLFKRKIIEYGNRSRTKSRRLITNIIIMVPIFMLTTLSIMDIVNLNIILIPLVALSLLIILVFITKFISDLLKDRRRFLVLEFFDEMDRESIEKSLYSLKTNHYKYKVLSELDLRNTRVTGKWKNDTYPRLSYGRLQELLTRLEAKWSNWQI